MTSAAQAAEIDPAPSEGGQSTTTRSEAEAAERVGDAGDRALLVHGVPERHVEQGVLERRRQQREELLHVAQRLGDARLRRRPHVAEDEVVLGRDDAEGEARRPLRVDVEHTRAAAVLHGARGDRQRGGRLAHAALEVHHRDRPEGEREAGGVQDVADRGRRETHACGRPDAVGQERGDVVGIAMEDAGELGEREAVGEGGARHPSTGLTAGAMAP